MAEINKLSVGKVRDKLRSTDAPKNSKIMQLDGKSKAIEEEIHRLRATRRRPNELTRLSAIEISVNFLQLRCEMIRWPSCRCGSTPCPPSPDKGHADRGLPIMRSAKPAERWKGPGTGTIPRPQP